MAAYSDRHRRERMSGSPATTLPKRLGRFDHEPEGEEAFYIRSSHCLAFASVETNQWIRGRFPRGYGEAERPNKVVMMILENFRERIEGAPVLSWPHGNTMDRRHIGII